MKNPHRNHGSWLFFPWNNWKIREHSVDVALRTNGLMESEGLGGFKEGSYQLQEVGSGRGHRFWANSSRQPSHAQQFWPTDTHMSHVMLPVASSTEMSVLVLGPRLPRITMSTMSLEITGKTHWPRRSVAPLKLSNVQETSHFVPPKTQYRYIGTGNLSQKTSTVLQFSSSHSNHLKDPWFHPPTPISARPCSAGALREWIWGSLPKASVTWSSPPSCFPRTATGDWSNLLSNAWSTRTKMSDFQAQLTTF